MEKPQRPPVKSDETNQARKTPIWFVLIVLLLTMYIISQFWSNVNRSTILYSFFIEQLERNNVLFLEIDGGEARGTFRDPPDAPREFTITGELKPQPMQDGAPRKLLKQFRVDLPPSEGERQHFAQKLDEAKKKKPDDDSEPLQVAYANQAPVQYMFLFLMLGVPLLLMAFAWFMFRRTRDQFVGGGFLNSFSRSTAKRYEPSEQRTTFSDVAAWKALKPTCKRSLIS